MSKFGIMLVLCWGAAVGPQRAAAFEGGVTSRTGMESTSGKDAAASPSSTRVPSPVAFELVGLMSLGALSILQGAARRKTTKNFAGEEKLPGARSMKSQSRGGTAKEPVGPKAWEADWVNDDLVVQGPPVGERQAE